MVSNLRKYKYQLIAIAVLLVVFAIITTLALTGVLDNFEARVHYAMRGLGGYRFRRAMQIIADLGVRRSIIIIVAILVALPWTRRDYGLPVAAASGLSALLNNLLKIIFRRSRPMGGGFWGEYSFPSGHAQVAATLYIGLVIMLFINVNRKAIKIPLASFCIALVTVIGFQRVLIEIHYIADVLAGWAMGAAIAMGTFIFWDFLARVTNKFKRNKKFKWCHEFVFCKKKYVYPIDSTNDVESENEKPSEVDSDCVVGCNSDSSVLNDCVFIDKNNSVLQEDDDLS